jgi:glycosyltransferase involved in cell wall biosynthesis
MVIDSFFPGTGGAEIQVELLAKALSSDGHDVNIVAPLLDPTKRKKDSFNSIPLERIPYPRIKVIGAIVLAVRFAWLLIKRRNNYDAIHVHTVKNLATIVGLLKPFFKASLIAKISGAWEFHGGLLDPALEHRLTHRLRNHFVKRYDYLQTISAYTRQRLEAAGYSANKIQMIPNAVDLSRFQCDRERVREKRSYVNIVFGGRMAPVKGLDVLIQAWAKVISNCGDQDPRLLLAGDGPIKGQLVELVEKCQLSHSVTFIDWVPEIFEVLKYADIYVQPSLQEGLPNSVLEAMAAALPIVATRVSGNEDLVFESKNGVLVEVGCVDELAEALCKLIANPGLRLAMGKHSRHIIETSYQLPTVLEKLSKAYRREL